MTHLVDPRQKPASKLGEFSVREMPDDYDDTKHGTPPVFVKYAGVVEKILEMLTDGCTQAMIAQQIGVSRSTYCEWLRRGRRAREDLEKYGEDAELGYWDAYYIQLLELVEAKDAEVQQTLLSRIYDAGNDSWQANAWILERRWPEHWSTRQTVTHQGHDGEEIKYKFTLDLGEEDARQKIIEAQEADYELLEEAS